MKKELAVLLTAVLGTAFLAGCSSSDGPTAMRLNAFLKDWDRTLIFSRFTCPIHRTQLTALLNNKKNE
ncbi:MAG: YgdI/YgdR family lipoprotein [Lachnospiraceae bacterium]|jgi:hypothetical protein|nr:YgdI/YgdR family lipoprotein [Lachnospiraceae bacterium]